MGRLDSFPYGTNVKLNNNPIAYLKNCMHTTLQQKHTLEFPKRSWFRNPKLHTIPLGDVGLRAKQLMQLWANLPKKTPFGHRLLRQALVEQTTNSIYLWGTWGKKPDSCHMLPLSNCSKRCGKDSLQFGASVSSQVAKQCHAGGKRLGELQRHWQTQQHVALMEKKTMSGNLKQPQTLSAYPCTKACNILSPRHCACISWGRCSAIATVIPISHRARITDSLHSQKVMVLSAGL